MKNDENEFLAAHAEWLAAGAKLNRDVQPLWFEAPDDERIRTLIREHDEAHQRYMAARAKYREQLRRG